MRRGFTLIELLIVVAIIAILAAIAVPNFMEAQVRSKVSRVMADMRSMATAIESYAVDNNRAPIGPREYAYQHGGSFDLRPWAEQLTTPVAYISTIPEDAFLTMQTTQGGFAGQQPTHGSRGPGDSFDYAFFDCDEDVRPENDNLADVYEYLVAHSTTWLMTSAGPSLVTSDIDMAYMIPAYLCRTSFGYTVNTSWPVQGTYDPTNGTKSRGYIMRSNQGVVAAPAK